MKKSSTTGSSNLPKTKRTPRLNEKQPEQSQLSQASLKARVDLLENELCELRSLTLRLQQYVEEGDPDGMEYPAIDAD